jgi:formylglycine-generating enzyme required for sulfatase activity
MDERERAALVASRSLRSQDAHELRSLAGTLPYIAPERFDAAGRPPDPRVDVYSLGVLLFEALAGRPPGGLELPSELRPELDRRWDQVAKKALASDPARRFGSIAAFRAAVLAIGRPDGARASGSSARLVSLAPEPTESVLVPAGRFLMGEPANRDASPVREVSLGAFLVDKVPVTNGAYLAFVLATRARAPRAWPARAVAQGRMLSALRELPVTGITWPEADAYARWAGKRLPTEAEWERAARGRAGRPFPYGKTFDGSKIHVGQTTLARVTDHPEGATDEGVLDLTGNAWEWCADWFGPYEAEDRLDPRGPPRGDARVIRGGFDPALSQSASAWYRGYLRPDVTNARVGFRCVRPA